MAWRWIDQCCRVTVRPTACQQRFIITVGVAAAASRAAARAAAKRVGATLAAAALSLAVLPALAVEQSCVGVTLPATISAADMRLALNGTGLREATFLRIDVYVAALYLPAPAGGDRAIFNGGDIGNDLDRTDGGAIAAADIVKQMRLVLLRDVAQADMAENMNVGFRRAAGEDYPHHAAAIARLQGWIPPLVEGDTFTLTYVPGRGTVLAHNDTVLGRIEGTEFAQTLFRVWLGEVPLSPSLKRGLLGGACAE